MGNSWFQFKEFRIEQGRTTMKVCTDSCIFGAYVAMRESEELSAKVQFLDVGAGTGLLSLMVTQKLGHVNMMAVEKDAGSVLDCRLNFESSPWSEKLCVILESLEEFAKGNSGCFDRIICNPPFFLDHLQSPDQGRNRTMHNTEQDWENWLQLLSSISHPKGRIWLLLDPGTWEKTKPILSATGLVVREDLTLLQAKGRLWRNIVCLMKEKTSAPEYRQMEVYESPGTLHPVIRGWLYDYYL